MAKIFDSKSIRNIGIVGHRGCGKTSLSEAILFQSGVTSRLGSVDAWTSVFDHTEEEKSHGFSISAKPSFVEWKKHKVNFVDTPGDLSFLTDSKNALKIVDLATFVVSATEGIQVATEKLWREAGKQALPRSIFISKLDKEHTNSATVVLEIQETFPNTAAIPIQVPIGSQSDFRGVVDLLSMKAYLYKQDGSGESRVCDIPEELVEEVGVAREVLIERIAEVNDELLEKYLETMELEQKDIESGFQEGVRVGSITPILFGSGTENIGVSELLDFFTRYAPNPLEHKPLEVYKGEDLTELEVVSDGSLCALVFKTMVNRSGKFSFFRVFQGEASSNTEYFNGTKNSSERLGALAQFQGRNQLSVESLSTGDIGAVAKLKDTDTGDTICSKESKFRFDLIQKPSSLLSYALKSTNEDKAYQALLKIAEEDFSLILERNPNTHEMLVRGQGQIHIDVTIEKMEAQTNLKVELNPPSIEYKETIRSKVAGVEGKYKKQSGGRGQFGVCVIDMRPTETGEGFVFENGIVGGAIPRQYIPAVEKGIIEAAEKGVLAGFPTIDFHVCLHDGKYHDVDSSEQAFKMAGIYAFRDAVDKCHPMLLEPYVFIEVTVPAEYQGTISGDMNSRRGRLEGTEYRGKNVTIQARVPKAEVLSYANQLTSMTEGRGLFEASFSHYEQVPSHIQSKVVVATAEKT